MAEKLEVPCLVPCKSVSDKLELIFACLGKKVSMKLFLALASFVFVVIGGAQWKIVESIGAISTNVAGLVATVTETKKNIEEDKLLFKTMSEKIRGLELRERERNPTYFNPQRKEDYD